MVLFANRPDRRDGTSTHRHRRNGPSIYPRSRRPLIYHRTRCNADDHRDRPRARGAKHIVESRRPLPGPSFECPVRDFSPSGAEPSPPKAIPYTFSSATATTLPSTPVDRSVRVIRPTARDDVLSAGRIERRPRVARTTRGQGVVRHVTCCLEPGPRHKTPLSQRSCATSLPGTSVCARSTPTQPAARPAVRARLPRRHK